MRVDDLLVEVRDKTLQRVGAISPDWLTGKFQPVANGVGTWSLSLPSSHPMAAALMIPGSGIVVTQRTGPTTQRTLISGPTNAPKRVRNKDNVKGTLTFSGTSDTVLLAHALAFPDPAHVATAQAVANDERTGNAETLMRAFVNANIGPGAIASRREGLRQFIALATDLARGPVVTKSPRFQTLLSLLQEIALLGSLRFRLVQVSDEIVLEIDDAVDRTDLVRLDVENGTLTSEQLEITPPTITRAIVAGQGEGVDRAIVQRSTTESADAEDDWGLVIERFIDARDKSVTAELEQKGDEALLASGFTARSLKVNASDSQTMRYGIDWVEGDIVGVVVDGVTQAIDVTGAAVVVGADGVLVGAAIGDISQMDQQTSTTARVEATEKRVSTLERETGSTVASDVAATPDTVVLRDAAGRAQIATPAAADDIANKDYVDGVVVPASYWVASPVGVPLFWPFTATIPSGFTEYDGGVESEAAMPALFAVVGTQYNTGSEGAGNFRKPDMRGVVPAGYKSGDAVFGAGVGSKVGAATHSHGTSTLVAAIYAGYWKTRNAVAAWTATNSGGVTAPGANSTTNNPAAAIEGTTDAASSVQPSLLGRWIARYENVTLAPAGSTASTAATPNTVVQRDANGRAQVVDPSASGDVATKGYVDQGYRLGAVVYFTSSGTFTKASYPWARAVRVRVQGGGGGGGGAAASSSGNTSLGTGGGGGGYAESIVPVASLSASETVTVGAGGSATSGGSGGTGGSSSFGAHAVASGGGGGAVKPNNAYAPYVQAGAGGAGSAGDFRCGGGAGSSGASADTLGSGGGGGSSQLGGGGRGFATGSGSSSAVGEPGANYGGGGGGAFSTTGGAARAGGAGAPGVVIVEVFA